MFYLLTYLQRKSVTGALYKKCTMTLTVLDLQTVGEQSFALYMLLGLNSCCGCDTDSLVDTETHPLVLFPCGLSAGCLAAIVTHPADVIKTHLQMTRVQRGATRLAVHYVLQVKCAMYYR